MDVNQLSVWWNKGRIEERHPWDTPHTNIVHVRLQSCKSLMRWRRRHQLWWQCRLLSPHHTQRRVFWEKKCFLSAFKRFLVVDDSSFINHVDVRWPQSYVEQSCFFNLSFFRLFAYFFPQIHVYLCRYFRYVASLY